jgi:hypothetical protein
MSASTLANLGRPSTVPAKLSAEEVQSRRLINMLAKGDMSDGQPGTPTRRQQRLNSDADLNNSGVRNFKENSYYFQSPMGRGEPLSLKDEDCAAYGLIRDKGVNKPGIPNLGRQGLIAGPGSATPVMSGRRGGSVTPTAATPTAVNIYNLPFTNNQLYGIRAHEGDAPSSAADRGRKMKTVSNVVMGM